MTTKQMNRLAMYIAVQVFLLSSTTATAALTALAAQLVKLGTLITRIRRLSRLQSEPLAGAVVVRTEALADSQTLALEVAGVVRCYAKNANRPELAALVQVTPNSFRTLRQIARIELAQRIHDAALSVLAELAPYGVTAETLGELQTAITNTDESMNGPRSATVDRKVATIQLAESYEEIESLLVDEIDPLLFLLRRKNPGLWQRYQVARQVLDLPGVRSANDTPPATPVAPESNPNVTQPKAA